MKHLLIAQFSKQTIQWLQLAEGFNRALKVSVTLRSFSANSKFFYLALPILLAGIQQQRTPIYSRAISYTHPVNFPRGRKLQCCTTDLALTLFFISEDCRSFVYGACHTSVELKNIVLLF